MACQNTAHFITFQIKVSACCSVIFLPTLLEWLLGADEKDGETQDASKSLDELEILRGTLQAGNGIHMICTPRLHNEE